MDPKQYITQLETINKEDQSTISIIYPMTIPDAIIGLIEVVQETSRSYLSKITKIVVSGQNQDKIFIPEYDGYILSNVICISNTLNICIGIGKNESDSYYYAKLNEAIPDGEKVTYRCIYNKL